MLLLRPIEKRPIYLCGHLSHLKRRCTLFLIHTAAYSMCMHIATCFIRFLWYKAAGRAISMSSVSSTAIVAVLVVLTGPFGTDPMALSVPYVQRACRPDRRTVLCAVWNGPEDRSTGQELTEGPGGTPALASATRVCRLDIAECDIKFRPWRRPEASLGVHRTRRDNGCEHPPKRTGRPNERLRGACLR